MPPPPKCSNDLHVFFGWDPWSENGPLQFRYLNAPLIWTKKTCWTRTQPKFDTSPPLTCQSLVSFLLGVGPSTKFPNQSLITQTMHVWYLPIITFVFFGKCREICNLWIVWVIIELVFSKHVNFEATPEFCQTKTLQRQALLHRLGRLNFQHVWRFHFETLFLGICSKGISLYMFVCFFVLFCVQFFE